MPSVNNGAFGDGTNGNGERHGERAGARSPDGFRVIIWKESCRFGTRQAAAKIHITFAKVAGLSRFS